MNARELLVELEGMPPLTFDDDGGERHRIMCAALRLLAAAEANDGTTPETDIARAIDQLNLVAVGLEPTFSVSAKWVKGAIALIEALRNERNGLAARVGELEPDAERYRWLRDAPKTNRVPHISQYPYQPAIDRAEYPLFTTVGLDAAIDAARSKP